MLNRAFPSLGVESSGESQLWNGAAEGQRYIGTEGDCSGRIAAGLGWSLLTYLFPSGLCLQFPIFLALIKQQPYGVEQSMESASRPYGNDQGGRAEAPQTRERPSWNVACRCWANAWKDGRFQSSVRGPLKVFKWFQIHSISALFSSRQNVMMTVFMGLTHITDISIFRAPKAPAPTHSEESQLIVDQINLG